MPHTSAPPILPGDRAPFLSAARADGRFFSSDLQSGRATLYLLPSRASPEAAARSLSPLGASWEALERQGVRHGVEIVVLSRPGAAFRDALGGRAEAAFVADEAALERLAPSDEARACLVDPGGRVIHLGPLTDAAGLSALLETARGRISRPSPRRLAAAAPVLIVANVLDPEACAAFIEVFEAGAHQPGRMASVAADGAVSRLDPEKKRRRDLELQPGQTAHGAALAVLANRLAPEVRRAFAAEVDFADRILLARYDDDGGCFRRHRDNLAPQTRFRDFAVSINLNDDYAGGELAFPEDTDDLIAPAAGSAAVFSAGLLHEARPVTRGRRYVLLSFLCRGRAAAAAPEERGGT